MFSRIKIVAGFAVFAAFVFSACSNGSTEAGAGADGVRTIHVRALDSLRFEPANITVRVGERVRFVVTNEGSATHEFILGDEATQMEHEQEMSMGASMEHGTMDLPALTLAPGETQTTVVTFDRPGTIFYGCHQAGHYADGMVGTITVS